MKLSPTKYPIEKNVAGFVVFPNPLTSAIALVVAQRLAAFVRDKFPGKKMNILVGVRSYEEQQKRYEERPDLAAKPGYSWHQYRCAVDVAESSKYMIYQDYSRTWSQQTLMQYGLYIPLNLVDSPNQLEWWHIQPIETKGVSDLNRVIFLDYDDMLYTIPNNRPLFRVLSVKFPTMKGDDVKLDQNNIVRWGFGSALGTSGVDGYYGPKSADGNYKMEAKANLVPDKICDLKAYATCTPAVYQLNKSGYEVDNIVKLLWWSGFLTSPAHTVADAEVLNAIGYFQTLYGLKIDKWAGFQTYSKLFPIFMK